MKNFVSSSLFFLTALFIVVSPAFGQKMTAEDVLAKHLDSIGTSEKRAAVKNQLIFANVVVEGKGAILRAGGKSVFFSAGVKNMWGLTLDSNDYPKDQFGYNGKQVKVDFTRPGVRSVLGGFILTYEELLKDGLLGGALSSSWALLSSDRQKYKLSYDGTKKIDNKETVVLSYLPKGGSSLNIKMFFDAKNFQHLRTEYSRVIAATQGASIDSSAGRNANRYRLVENFSDFKKMGDLTLPSSYTISYSYYGSAGQSEIDWKFNVTNFSFNQKLDDASFEIAGK